MSSTSADAGLTPFLRALASPAGIIATWAAHGLWFVLLLPLLTPTIAHVDANSADIMQRSFAPAYQFKNPGLYEWLELAVQAVAGPGPRSFLVVRYAIMGAMAVALYALVARLSGSRAQGAAASYGLMAFYWFAWYFHDSISHSILVALACVLFLAAVLRWIERQDVATALLLGLAVGFGLLAKLNFAVMVAGVAATVATDRSWRRLFLDARLLLAVAVAASIATPVLLAHASLGKGVAAVVYDQVVERDLGFVASRLVGGGKLLVNYVLFLLPWGLLAWFVLGPRAAGAVRPARAPEAERFLLRLAVTTAVLVFAGVVAVGARSVSERYLFPVLLAVPVLVHVAWGRRVDGRRQMLAFGGAAVAVLALVTAVRVFNAAAATWGDRDNKRYDPYADLGPVLADMGYGDAFFIASDRYEAGNLMAFMPDARAAGLATQRRWMPMSYPAGARCVLFWRGRFETAASAPEPPAAPENLAPHLPGDGRIATVRVPWRRALVGEPRVGVFHLVDLGRDAAACREVFGARSDG